MFTNRFLKNSFNLTSVLVVIFMIAACAPVQTASPTVAPPVPTVAPAATEVPAATEAPAPTVAPVKEITLNIQHWQPSLVPESAPWWDEILRGFEAEHPGVTVVNNFIPFANYLTTLETQIAGKQMPDIFYGHVKAAEIARAGLSVDLTTVLDETFISTFYSGALDQFIYPGDSGGTKIIALPMDAQFFALFVNPAIMEELGLEVPQTWDELITMTPKIKAAGYVPLAFGNQAQNVCIDFVLPLIAQTGGNVVKMDDSGKGWDSPEVIQAFEILNNLARAGVFVDGVNAVTEEQGRNLAFQGKAAMLYGPNSNVNVIKTDAPTTYADTFIIAKVPALAADKPHFTGSGSGNGWVVNKGANQEMAIEFLKYFYSPDVYNKFIQNTQRMPSVKSALDQVTNPHVKLMAGWLDDGVDHILFGQGSWDALAGPCQSVLDGSMSPTDAVKQIQAAVDKTRSQ